MKSLAVRFCLPCVLAPGLAHAQFTSAIQGTAGDASSAVVPDATISVTNLATGITRTATSSTEGLYRVLSLGPGTYRVLVKKTGFMDARRDAVVLGTNETLRVDFVLAGGGRH